MDDLADEAAAEARGELDVDAADLTEEANATGAIAPDAGEAVEADPDAAGASDDVAALAAELAAELAAANEKHLRLYAEFDNFRRRAVRDRQDAEQRGMGAVMKGLLDSLDDLARVAHVDPAGTDAKTVLEGVALMEKKLLKSLAGHGLEAVDPVGQPFDPAVHEAITTAPAASEDEDDLVAQVFQVGYILNGTLLRPARVVVKQWNG
jgi:molecular chaperone GrpE